jgi:hypothetical protein
MRRGTPIARIPSACLASSRCELVALTGLIIFYMAVDEFLGESNYDSVNVAGPIWLAGALCLGATQTAFAHPAAAWTALFWLRVATAIYFGIGAAVPFFINDLTRSVLESFYNASAEEMLEVNLITALGVFTVLITVRGMSNLVSHSPSWADRMRRGHELLLWGILFGSIGTVIKYAFAVPYSFGLVGEVLPGVVLQISMLTSVSIYLLGSWAFTTARSYIPLVTAFALFDMLIGVLSFSKLDTIFPLIMYLLAMVHTRVTTLRIALAVLAGAVCFYVATPIVQYGRDQLLSRYQSITGAGFRERFEILDEYFRGEQANQLNEEFQAPVARLSYMNQSAFAVHLYDSGFSGDTLEAILMVAVPRFIWADKPNLNFLGQEFNMRATNSSSSLSWPGQYAEAYWNLGWIGIPILFIPLGIIYYYLSRYTVAVFESRKWAYFPVVLFGMKFGIEVGSPYATAVVGGLAFIVSAHAGCWALERTVAFVLRKRVAG